MYKRQFLADPAPTKYDMVIGNPPYKKIPKDAAEALSMPDICYGAPNLYFLFSQMSLFDLKENGEMVYIIPRSWTSGAYFKAFRQKFLSQGAIEHIHLFVSRDKVFEKESVLQETIIIKVKKTEVKPEYITVTSTNSNQDFTEITTFSAPYKTVISGDDCYVYLVTNEDEVNTLDCLNKFDDTLPSLGLKMKTGLTVDFQMCIRDRLHDVSRIALGALLHFSVVELQLFLRVTDFLAQCLAYQIFAKLVSLCSLRSKVAFGIGELLRESCGRRTGKHSGDGRRSHPRVCFRRHYIIASNSASIAG